MDISKVISRAGQITWRWKILWLLGFLAALGGGARGSGGEGGLQYSYQLLGAETPAWMSDLERWSSAPGAIALVFALFGLALLLGLALWLVSIIANGGLIAGVQQVEEEGATSFRRGWRGGVERFWTLLGIDLLFGTAILALVGLLIGFVVVAVLAGGGSLGNETLREMLPAVVLPLILCGVPLCCGVVLVGIALGVIRTYAQRAAVLEKHGALDAIGRGWQVLRRNLGNTLLLLLILAGIGIGVGWVLGLLGTAVAGVSLFSLLERTPSAAELIRLSVGAAVLSLVGLFVNAVLTTFTSAIWTLAYRDFTASKLAPVEAAPVVDGSLPDHRQSTSSASASSAHSR